MKIFNSKCNSSINIERIKKLKLNQSVECRQSFMIEIKQNSFYYTTKIGLKPVLDYLN